MVEQYFYSPSNGGFYFQSMKDIYENSEAGWPGDAVSISEKWYQYLMNGQSNGRVIVCNEYNQPVLSDPPLPTPDELIASAESQKIALMQDANNVIAPLERAVKLGMATSEEEKMLESWERYSVVLSRVDPRDAPDIHWPEVPGNVA
ncbi:TPA: tail fiber assembly protein [Escherichia coli]|nr:tail fiber assembly protein [Escherichia coli]